jgi:ATP-binding cassette subfamily F protein 3
MSLDDKEIRALAKNSKRSIKKEKQDQIREKRFALEREEILSKLSNKPVKIHARGDADMGRLKDIKLEGVSMALGSLELLNDVYVTFSDGRKYGLIGKNGIGKSTFLKHVAGTINTSKRRINIHLRTCIPWNSKEPSNFAY